MDGGDGCFGWEAGVLREMGMEAGRKDAVAAAVRRVRAAFAQPAITSPWYPWPLGWGGRRQMQDLLLHGHGCGDCFPQVRQAAS